jgi:hypothetical protein
MRLLVGQLKMGNLKIGKAINSMISNPYGPDFTVTIEGEILTCRLDQDTLGKLTEILTRLHALLEPADHALKEQYKTRARAEMARKNAEAPPRT